MSKSTQAEVLAVCIITLVTLATADNNALSKLFSKNGPELQPLEVQDLITSVVESPPDSISNDEKELISGLVKANQINESKCDYASLLKNEELVKETKEYNYTIVPYLKQIKQLQYNKCKPIFVEQLQKLVDEVEPSKLDKIAHLCMIKNIEEPHDGLVKNIVEMLRHKTVKMSTRDLIDEDLFKNLYLDSVSDVCGVVTNNIKPIMDIYELLFPDEVEGLSSREVADIIIENLDDPLTQKWYSYHKICKHVTEDYEVFVDDVQDLVLKQQPFFKKFYGFISSLGRKQ